MSYAKKSIVFIAFVLGIAAVGAFLSMRQGRENVPLPGSETDAAALPFVPAVPDETKESAPTTPSGSVALCVRTFTEQVRADDVAYEPSSVLFSFENSVSFKTAERVLSASGVSYANDDFNGESFVSKKWGVGVVAEGNEIEVICALRGNIEVRYADLNRIMTLHE